LQESAPIFEKLAGGVESVKLESGEGCEGGHVHTLKTVISFVDLPRLSQMLALGRDGLTVTLTGAAK